MLMWGTMDVADATPAVRLMEYTWGAVGVLTPIQMINTHDFSPMVNGTGDGLDGDSSADTTTRNVLYVFNALMFGAFLFFGLGGMFSHFALRVREQYREVLGTRERMLQMGDEVRSSLAVNVLSVQLVVTLTQIVELIGAYVNGTLFASAGNGTKDSTAADGHFRHIMAGSLVGIAIAMGWIGLFAMFTPSAGLNMSDLSRCRFSMLNMITLLSLAAYLAIGIIGYMIAEGMLDDLVVKQRKRHNLVVRPRERAGVWVGTII